jgi:hypothetical protein
MGRRLSELSTSSFMIGICTYIGLWVGVSSIRKTSEGCGVWCVRFLFRHLSHALSVFLFVDVSLSAGMVCGGSVTCPVDFRGVRKCGE